MKKIIALVSILIVLAGVIFVINFDGHEKNEQAPLETVLQNASELTTQKMVVSDVFETSKGNVPLFTKNKFLVKYHTVVSAGFNATEAEIDDRTEEIIIKIPHCTIDEESIKIKAADIELYDTNLALLNVEPEKIFEVLGEAEEHAKEIVNSEEYGFLAAADENAVKIIQGLFENVANGKAVVVEFK